MLFLFVIVCVGILIYVCLNKKEGGDTSAGAGRKEIETTRTAPRRVYKLQGIDEQGFYTRNLYEHQAQAEMRTMINGAVTQSEKDYVRNILNEWEKDGFKYKPYTGCEGFKRTCRNVPMPGKMYCKICFDNMNNHIFHGIGTCKDCSIGECAHPIPFPCKALK